MTRSVRWIGGIAAALVLLAMLALGTAILVFKNSVASASGTLTVSGLSAPVEVVRDGEGVPHIFAHSVEDLALALGFVHAQDRLWQMELQRRAGQGRLSEIFGERTYTTDVFLRTLDLYGSAERSFAALEPNAQRLISAYARGVNAFLERPTGLLEPRLPPEFLLLRHTPEPWRPADSVVIGKLMAFDLSGNLNFEMLRLALASQGLSAREIEDLIPGEAQDPPLPEFASLYPLRRPEGGPGRPRHAADWVHGVGGASNDWVVAGSHTLSGKPLLANDPHLRLSAPSVWYLAHLALERSGESAVNFVGALLSGVPSVVLGRGDHVAWGFTNTETDVEDVFIEKINPDNANEYLTPEGWRPFAIEPMAIGVRGGGVRTLERRRTRHGPVLPGFYRNLDGMLGPGYVAALQWVALSDDDTTVATGLFDTNLRGVSDYIERMRRYLVPMQSMVVADDTGNIAMIAPGRVPVRDAANKVMGRAPVPGWDATYDWKGYVRFEDLPREENPPRGAIGTSNARIVPLSYPHVLTLDWGAPFRQQRIEQLILSRGGHDVASMRAAQGDVLSPAALRLKALMVGAARRAGSSEEATLQQLAEWDARMGADATEPLIFMAWVRETVTAIYRDDLLAAFEQFFEMRASTLIRLLEGRATSRDWCDDRATPVHETCEQVISGALNAALKDLQRRYGANRTSWRWGAAHVAVGQHAALGQIPLIGPLFNVEVPSPGGNHTLNRGMVDFRAREPFANRSASSYRAIYDFADLDRSLFMQSSGQSGNPFSPHYRSFAERWAKVDYIEIPTSRERIAKIAAGRWWLNPQPNPKSIPQPDAQAMPK
jgi:penicillin G amidase